MPPSSPTNNPSPPSPPTSPPLPQLTPDIINDEAALLRYIVRSYAYTSFDVFSSAGYVDFAYTVENWRWDGLGQEESEPLSRKEMDRLWVRVVMEFWVRMAWCWEGEVEGVVIALLEVSFASWI